MLDATKVAAANTEISTLKTLCRGYLADHPSLSSFTSDDLVILYSGKPKAKYYFDRVTLLVTRVDMVSDGWADIVFSLSEQKWKKGAPDNNHGADQDIP